MQEIDALREQIANLDREIIRLAAERMQTAEKIGEIKAAQGLEIVVPSVEGAVIERYVTEGTSLGISEETCRKLARILIDEAVMQQQNLKQPAQNTR
jgi:Chorismate mutase